MLTRLLADRPAVAEIARQALAIIGWRTVRDFTKTFRGMGMSSAVSISRAGGLPIPLTAAGETLLRRFESALEESSSSFTRMAIPAAAAPSAEARDLMQRRLALVEAWLEPADTNEVGRMIAGLAQVLAVQNAGQDAVSVAAGLYVSALGRYPAWAVGQVCRRYVDGLIGDRRFMPSPGEIAHEVRKLIEPQVAERARLIRALDAEVIADPDPEMAERARKAAADLAARLTMPLDDEGTATAVETPGAILDRLKAEGLGGLKLSDTTLASTRITRSASRPVETQDA